MSFQSLVKCILLNFIFICYIIASPPAIPVPISPSDNATGIEPTIILRWGGVSGAASYSIRFSHDPSFPSNNTVTITNLTATNQTLYGLFNGRKYYWQVSAIDSSSQQSSWSRVQSFTTRFATTTNGNNKGPTDVGIWYCTYSLRKINVNIWDGTPFVPLCPDGNFCSTSDLADTAVIDYHLQKIADAKIDFLIFENTNGGFSSKYTTNTNWNYYVEVSRTVCKRIKAWNDLHSWKLRYIQAIGCYWSEGAYMGGGSFGDCVETQAEVCYNDFVTNTTYGGASNWYHLDGKPLLVIFIATDPSSAAINKWYEFAQSNGFPSSYASKFTIRFAATGQRGMYGWIPWGKDFAYNPPATGTILDSEVELVCPGYRNIDTSFNIPRDYGNFYLQCWNRVLGNVRPRIVVISSFNDYWERTAVWPAVTKSHIILPLADQWLGSDNRWQADMYWNMTKNYIKVLRGNIFTRALWFLSGGN